MRKMFVMILTTICRLTQISKKLLPPATNTLSLQKARFFCRGTAPQTTKEHCTVSFNRLTLIYFYGRSIEKARRGSSRSILDWVYVVLSTNSYKRLVWVFYPFTASFIGRTGTFRVGKCRAR